jgi:predicted metal-dependent peptidase
MTMTKQPQAVTEAMSYIIANKKTAFFATYLMQQMSVVYDDSVKTAETDGKTIWVGDWFCNLPILERAFVLCHEILHGVLEHMARSDAYEQRGFGMDLLPFSRKRANVAQDYVVNAALIESRIGHMPTSGMFRNHTDAERTWDDVYMETEEPPEDPDGEGSGKPGQGFDKHKKAPAGSKPGDKKQKQAVAQARNAAKAAGELPAGLERIINGVLNPEVPWKEVLQDFLTVSAGKDEATFRKLNRRRLVTPPPLAWPGKDGFHMNCVVVAIDCSGSIGQKELQAFLGETKAILSDVKPRELHILWWDTEAVHREVEVDEVDSLEQMNAYGGGGTNYTCVPKMIGELDLDPDAVVCLTDGYVMWPDAGDIQWPHITVTTGKHAPFGQSTVIHVQDQDH